MCTRVGVEIRSLYGGLLLILCLGMCVLLLPLHINPIPPPILFVVFVLTSVVAHIRWWVYKKADLGISVAAVVDVGIVLIVFDKFLLSQGIPSFCL